MHEPIASHKMSYLSIKTEWTQLAWLIQRQQNPQNPKITVSSLIIIRVKSVQVITTRFQANSRDVRKLRLPLRK